MDVLIPFQFVRPTNILSDSINMDLTKPRFSGKDSLEKSNWLWHLKPLANKDIFRLLESDHSYEPVF